jgi:osmotically inducible protein OsmC
VCVEAVQEDFYAKLIVGQKLLEQAHQVCPYSNAVRGNVDVQLSLVDA